MFINGFTIVAFMRALLLWYFRVSRLINYTNHDASITLLWCFIMGSCGTYGIHLMDKITGHI